MKASELNVVKSLRELDARSIGALAGVMRRRTWEDGELILKQGDLPDGLYFLLSGHIRVERRLPDGGTVGLSTLGPGAMFGALSALDGGQRAAHCLSWGSTSCGWLSQSDFLDLNNGSSPMAMQFQLVILKVMFGDLRATNRRLAELATLPALDMSALGEFISGLG
ncbi:MAG: CRP/FNR family cyclic AMP-dependent transcriptional regulator [Myxococcota bacterium]|jgi:CRP/FNR family cyclic AMP-dependent transcriptional regulator